jgi:hypothetical protein
VAALAEVAKQMVVMVVQAAANQVLQMQARTLLEAVTHNKVILVDKVQEPPSPDLPAGVAVQVKQVNLVLLIVQVAEEALAVKLV